VKYLTFTQQLVGKSAYIGLQISEGGHQLTWF